MSVTVSKLYFYHMKSARGFYQRQANVIKRGLEHDRLWMAVDKDGIAITQRSAGCSKMARILATPELDGRLRLQFDNKAIIRVDDPHASEVRTLVNAQMHQKPLVGYDAGNDAAEWMSDVLERKVRLLRAPDDKIRQISQEFGRVHDETGFSDGYPLLITSEESMKAMGLTDMNRFRPNIVLRGLKPFEEDAIKEIRIGKHVKLTLQKPCDRCGIPGFDQITGDRDPRAVEALIKFRRNADMKLTFFGQNASPDICGPIAVNDNVFVIKRKTPHRWLENLNMRFGA